jgi:mRNA interferase YafQ
MIKRGKDIDKLDEVIDLLVNEQPLLSRHKDHPLLGTHKGKGECHVEPDWLLMYRVDMENREIIFYRTGTHSDLY